MKIQEIKLLANDLDNLVDFYNRILELPIVEHSSIYVSFQIGSSKLVFELSEEVVNPYYHFAFNITESKKDLALNWLKAKGIHINLINGEEFYFSESWNSTSIFFYDPTGNIVELIARHNTKNRLGHDFSTDDLLNISEIGIPALDVINLSEYLLHQYKEQIYISGNSMFTPIGDEEGLLILSSLDRNWLGSNKKVEIFPLEIVIADGKEDSMQILNYPYIIRNI
ncbi:VOC family protein [Cohnella luojiensis]|uniref:Ring-cleaving dioxygenase n=1 Tax=Cohnella luojiensis TaxID=652876 RepID=A0A4Y8LS78_9BACL|nr:VOC family protein [Cohnella luojiensis]TFE19350.1 ring-cleaving dioxygenase [Cohnella luojiensis]